MDKVLAKEDIKFLKELGNELKTQDTLATAKPVFYQIYEREKIGPVEAGYGDGVDYYIGELCNPIIVNDLTEAKEVLIKDYGIEKEGLKDVLDFDDLEEFCEENNIEFMPVGYVFVNKYQNAFLTQKAYQKHVEANHYHYSDPHFYVKHGWRNPELKRLLEIVEKFAD